MSLSGLWNMYKHELRQINLGWSLVIGAILSTLAWVGLVMLRTLDVIEVTGHASFSVVYCIGWFPWALLWGFTFYVMRVILKTIFAPMYILKKTGMWKYLRWVVYSGCVMVIIAIVLIAWLLGMDWSWLSELIVKFVKFLFDLVVSILDPLLDKTADFLPWAESLLPKGK